MATNVPEHVNRRNLERGLAELRKWRKHAIKSYAQTENDRYQTRLRLLVEDLELAVYILERLLTPMSDNDTAGP